MSLSSPRPRRRRELAYLEAFDAVCTEGGFTAAAHRLGCSQPAISYQIRALERQMGTRLIERGGRAVVLTPAGERLRRTCRDLLLELAQAKAAWARGVQSAPLRLGSATGFGRYVLVPALERLLESEPEPLALRLRFDSASVVLRMLERGDCEAAFVYARRVTRRLRFEVVYDEELVLLAAPSRARGTRSPAGRGRRARVATLRDV